MVRVIDQQLDKALRLLKRQLSKDGTWRELKARAFYEKPSVKRRRRQRTVRRRLDAPVMRTPGTGVFLGE